MHRWFVAVLAALCGCVLVPAAAQAAEIEVSLVDGALTLVSDASDTSDTMELIEVERSISGPGGFTIEVRSANVDQFVEPVAVPECEKDAGDQFLLRCTGLTTNALNVGLGPGGGDGFEVSTPSGEIVHANVHGGDGNDFITGGDGNDVLAGDGGRDFVEGGFGDDQIDGYVGFGNPAAGPDDNDVLGGGPGVDVISDMGNTPEDKARYEAESGGNGITYTRQFGVDVSLNGRADDGHPTEDGQSTDPSVPPTMGGDNVGFGVDRIDGTPKADRLSGDSFPNLLYGAAGNDLLVGNDGADKLIGGGADDRLDAVDGGGVDASIDCGLETLIGASPGDVADVDAADPAPVNCAKVNRAGSGGTTNDGGGKTDTGQGPATSTGQPGTTKTPAGDITKLIPKKDVEVYPVRKVKFPSFLRGTRLCGRRKWCTIENVKKVLDARGVNYDLTEKPATDKQLEALVGKPVGIGQVLDQTPDADEEVETGPKKAVKVKLWTFTAKSLSKCDLKRPFVRVGSRVVKLTAYLKDMSPRKAEAALKDAGCKRSQYEIQDRFSRKVANPIVSGVKLVVDDGRRLRLTVSHGVPEIMFTYTKPRLVSGYIPVMWGDNNEVVIPQGEPTTLEVTPTKSGMGLTNLTVILRDSAGEQVDYEPTRADGSAELDLQIDKSGRYELWTSLCDKESDCVVGHKRIDVARLDPRRTYLGIDGLTYAQTGGKWKPVAAASSAKARAAQAADRASLGTLASEIVTRVFSSPLYRYAAKNAPNGPLYQAVLKLNAAAAAGTRGGMAGYYDALVKQGVEFTILAGGGNSATTIQRVDFVRKEAVYSDGNRVVTVPIYAIDVNNGALALKVDDVMLMPGGLFYLVTGGGISAGAGKAVTQVSATAPNLDLVDLAGATAIGLAKPGGAASLIGADGGTLIGADAGTLIGADGASLIGADGASLVGLDAASLIGADGASLIGADGASLIGADGASLIGADGASLLPGY